MPDIYKSYRDIEFHDFNNMNLIYEVRHKTMLFERRFADALKRQK